MDNNKTDQVKQKLKEIIVNDLEVDIAMEDIRDDISLYEDGIGLDSITLINFIVLIEKTFQFNFDEADVNNNLFSSLDSLAAYISARTASAEAKVQLQ